MAQYSPSKGMTTLCSGSSGWKASVGSSLKKSPLMWVTVTPGGRLSGMIRRTKLK
jgi:hypothetical protein